MRCTLCFVLLLLRLVGVSGFSPIHLHVQSHPTCQDTHVKPAVSKSLLVPRPSSLNAIRGANGIELANLMYDSTSTAFDAWEWTAVLGAPAALVAGAVLVTLSETRERMQPRKRDKSWVRCAKQWFRFLTVSLQVQLYSQPKKQTLICKFTIPTRVFPYRR